MSNISNLESKLDSKKELIPTLDLALALATELNRQIDAMDAALEDHHRLPLAA